MRFATLRTHFFAALSIAVAAPAAADISAAMSGASAEEGERLFRACSTCHTVDKGGRNRAGPNLYGIIGADVAAVDRFRYSASLTGDGGTWTLERLDAFLEDPRGTVPWTRMNYPGLKELEDRAHVIAYLNANSDSPVQFGATTGQAATSADAEEPYEFGVLFDAPGVEVTYYACVACHSERIVAQQGLTRAEWDDMLDWMVEEQGMWEIEEPDRTDILDYLAAHYNTDRPNFPPPVGQ